MTRHAPHPPCPKQGQETLAAVLAIRLAEGVPWPHSFMPLVPGEGPLVPASISKLLESTADRGPGVGHQTLPWFWAGAAQRKGICPGFPGALYIHAPFPAKVPPPQLGFLPPLCRNLGVGNREEAGVEAQGLPAVPTWAQFLPGAQRCGRRRREAPGRRVTFCFESKDSREGQSLGLRRG